MWIGETKTYTGDPTLDFPVIEQSLQSSTGKPASAASPKSSKAQLIAEKELLTKKAAMILRNVRGPRAAENRATYKRLTKEIEALDILLEK